MTGRAPGLLLPVIATAVVVAILTSLGVWQLRRMAWKHELIAAVAARIDRAPVAAPSLAEARGRDPADLDFVPVTVSGRWLSGIEARVHAVLGTPRGRWGGPGVWVMTPVERDDGSIVWVDRGFVPVDRIDPARRDETPPAGPVTLDGLMRRPEPRGWATPADDPAGGLWFVRDPATLSAAFGLDPARTAPFTVDASARLTPPGGLPQAGETRLVFSDDHLGYALTWFGLAAAALAVAVVRLRARRRETAAAV